LTPNDEDGEASQTTQKQRGLTKSKAFSSGRSVHSSQGLDSARLNSLRHAASNPTDSTVILQPSKRASSYTRQNPSIFILDDQLVKVNVPAESGDENVDGYYLDNKMKAAQLDL